jgi:RimJ/RimL family protein N-acetyltransferase
MYRIEGTSTKLVEIDIEDAFDIIELRNDERYNAYLFQFNKITVDSQRSWILENQKKFISLVFWKFRCLKKYITHL